MKCGNSTEVVHKDVVIIGNGPSGIALSYMLSGNIPYVTSTTHPDELLSIRLEPVLNHTLVNTNLQFLANGLEGRTTNPVSLLLDSLIHPCADIGLEMDPLVDWRPNGQKMNEMYYIVHRFSIAIITFLVYLHLICCCSIAWTVYQFPFHYELANAPAVIKCYGTDLYTMSDMYCRFFYFACLMTLNAGFGLPSHNPPSVLFITQVWLCSRLLYILAIAYFIQLYTAYHSSTQKYLDMICEVKDYMRHRQIPNFLQKRIMSYYDIKFQNCFFNEANILSTVSGQLRQEIIMNTCRKLVEEVSFFKNLPLTLMIRIVSSLTYDIFLTNDVITKVGTVGDCMYFIFNGTVAIYSVNGKEIDHVVLGKGPPGGSWHAMDPEILTLSLGSWMSLPGMKYESRNSSEKRATARSVAEYYQKYVNEMGLSSNFKNHVLVTKIEPYIVEDTECKRKWVEKVNNDICQKERLCSRPERKDLARSKSYCLSNAFNYILNRGQDRCQKRSWEQNETRNELAADNKYNNDTQFSVRKKREIDRSISTSSVCELSCNKCNLNNENTPVVPEHNKYRHNCDLIRRQPRWIVEAIDLNTKACISFTCNNLVLANGCSDLPNKLNISKYKTDPYWLLHDLRSLEIELDLYLQNNLNPDPVLVVGAGLSAADAIIATKARNVPVVHLFRNKTDLTKQLPENMYPEYHKVHQMMKNGINYPMYTALAEYTLTNLDENSHKATIMSKEGKYMDITVSYVIVLIGSQPDMSFLPENYNLGVKKQLPIDGKKNTAHINKLTHQIHGHEGLYAIGPVAGDNFVRFLPGGALAVLSDIYRKNEISLFPTL